MIILFKYCANMENCVSFRGFGYIYIYIYRNDISTAILVQLYIYIYRLLVLVVHGKTSNISVTWLPIPSRQNQAILQQGTYYFALYI